MDTAVNGVSITRRDKFKQNTDTHSIISITYKKKTLTLGAALLRQKRYPSMAPGDVGHWRRLDNVDLSLLFLLFLLFLFLLLLDMSGNQALGSSSTRLQCS